MQFYKKLTAAAVSSVLALSSLFVSANASPYQYEREKYWYNSDESSFRCTDFGADSESDIDYYGQTPANVFVPGKISYDVTFNVCGTDKTFTVMIGVSGDTNMNGTLDVGDAATIAKKIAEGSEYSLPFNLFLADFNHDGKVLAGDAALIAKHIANESIKTSTLKQQAKTERAERILELVNEERAKAGLNALTLNTDLSKMSEARAREIAVLFSHDRPDGSSWSTALSEYNISYIAAAENIAAGYATPEAVVQGWMNSAGHRANILNPEYTEMGLGYYSDSSVYQYYWAQNFITTK